MQTDQYASNMGMAKCLVSAKARMNIGHSQKQGVAVNVL
jgi:hypothetical protein